MHGLRAGRDDRVAELDGLLLAGLLLPLAGGFFDLAMVGIDEAADAAHHLDLAHLGHAGQAAGELADDLVFVRAQLVEIDRRPAEVTPRSAKWLDLVHDGGHVQQRLGRDAAHVQADAAQRGIALDQHHFQAEVGGAERGRVAAGAGAQHQHVAFDVGPAGVDEAAARCRRRPRGRWGRVGLAAGAGAAAAAAAGAGAAGDCAPLSFHHQHDESLRTPCRRA